MDMTNEEVSRGLLYVETHKKRDGSYGTENARVVCVSFKAYIFFVFVVEQIVYVSLSSVY